MTDPLQDPIGLAYQAACNGFAQKRREALHMGVGSQERIDAFEAANLFLAAADALEEVFPDNIAAYRNTMEPKTP